MIPKGWKKQPINTVCDLSGGTGFPIKYQNDPNGNIPFIKVSDMNKICNLIHITRASNHITNEVKSIIKAKTFPSNAIVFPKVGAALLTNKRRILTESTIVDNNIMALVPKQVDYKFLYFISQNIDFANFVQSGAVPSINQKTVGEIEILLPPLPEQKRIAEILTSVDAAIQATETVISQTKRVKQGLLQELLTRGIGHSKFKNTEIGEIPEGWEVRKLGSLFENSKEKGDKGSRVYSVTMNRGLILREEVKKRTTSKLNENEHLKIKAGDIAYNMMRMWQGASGLANDDGIVSPAYVVCRPKNELNSKFFWLLFKQPKMIKTFENYSYGLTSDRLRLYYKDFKSIKVAVPPLNEQNEIVKNAIAIETSNMESVDQFESLNRVKSGLMQDLLTGRVRVRGAA